MKKGFIFIETLVVLCVLSVSLITIYSMYKGVLHNAKIRKYYDNINDVYKTNILLNMFNNNPSNAFVEINDSNCTTYMNTDCNELINEYGVVRMLYINNFNDITGISNSMIEYLDTIDNTFPVLVVQFARNNESYFSYLRVVNNE